MPKGKGYPMKDMKGGKKGKMPMDKMGMAKKKGMKK